MKQLSFLQAPENESSLEFSILGLKYIPNYITPAEEKSLIAIIDSQCWLSDLKRRVQHYGYKYDYKKRNVDVSHYLGPLPTWFLDLSERLFYNNYLKTVPN